MFERIISRVMTTAVLALLLGFASASAAEKLNLDDCIELALKTRASIIAARGSESVAAADKRSALGDFLPSIGATYSYSKGKITNIDPPNSVEIGSDTIYYDELDSGPSKTLGISGNMTLISFPNIFGYASARASHAAAKLDVLASEQDLIYSVKTAYYAYLAAVQNVDVQTEAVKRAEEQLKLIESRFDLGSASRSDVLKQKVQFGNDRLGLLQANNGVTNARAALAYTIGIDPRGEQEFDTEYGVHQYDGSLNDAIGFGLENNPSLLAREQYFSAANSAVRSAWSTYLPTLSVGADYQKSDRTDNTYFGSSDYSSASRSYGFSISWNIFDGFLRERQVTSAKVARNNAGAGLADTRNLTVSNIKTAFLETDQLREQKLVSEENVAAAEEDLKITQEKYNLGAATILDLLDAQVSLKQAQVALIQVDFDLNLAIAKLENAMGKK